MNTPEIIIWIIALVTGIGLGVFYFGGLWKTVQQTTKVKNPMLLYMGSFVLRTLIVLGGFYLIGQGEWKNLLFCLLGFITGRVAVKLYIKKYIEQS